MAAHTPRIPTYRHYRPKNLAVVRIDGRDVYLGRFNSSESREKYRRVIAEWLTRGPSPSGMTRPAAEDPPSPSVSELILAFWTRHAEAHYRRADGAPTGELANYRDSLRPLKDLYGATPACEFGPLNLKAVRQAMTDAGLSRTTINRRVGRIVRVFKWAVENELVPPGVHHGLKAVRGLQRGRSGAKEPPPVMPVADEQVEAVRPHVARQVMAMIDLQRLTGMRPGEVVILRTGDVDTSGAVWAYRPSGHKTAHHGRDSVVYLGPRAQAVLRPWLRPDPSEYLFGPREAMAEFRRRQRAERRTKLYPSQEARPRKADPKQRPGERYTTRSYCHAVGYGCRRAGIPSWNPHRLRYTAATMIRARFGLEAAQSVLGHAKPDTTLIYAEKDGARAREVAAEMG
jgi:integrase